MSSQLQQLYSLLEVDFSPLVLCAQVSPLLEQLEANEETKQYVESLKEVTLVRLIKQVCITGFVKQFNNIYILGITSVPEYTINKIV